MKITFNHTRSGLTVHDGETLVGRLCVADGEWCFFSRRQIHDLSTILCSGDVDVETAMSKCRAMLAPAGARTPSVPDHLRWDICVQMTHHQACSLVAKLGPASGAEGLVHDIQCLLTMAVDGRSNTDVHYGTGMIFCDLRKKV